MCRKRNRDAIRGSMIGGAIGDALGVPVEFLSEEDIFEEYGPEGITEYELDPDSWKALISDDTQMTMFTANGMLYRETRGCLRGIAGDPRTYIANMYVEWLRTQELADYPYEESFADRTISWLMEVPELYARRAPGRTCIHSMRSFRNGEEHPEDFYASVWNHKKGCGGVMRIAPVALSYDANPNEVAWEAAQVAGITHGHPLGYMPAAVIAYVICESVYGHVGKPLKEIILESRSVVRELFPDDKYTDELIGIIDDALDRSENDLDDLENIHALGEGWVAEETMSISLYCALKYEHDFSKAIITAVNHNGDSDSTGAVTGNILGARIGYDEIPEKWKKDLELHDVILELSDDMADGCPMEECGPDDPVWMRKYVRG